MNHVIAIFIALALASPAFADQQFGMPKDFNSNSSNSGAGAYGGYHDSYQSPQNDSAYRRYEQERHNRQQYRDNY